MPVPPNWFVLGAFALLGAWDTSWYLDVTRDGYGPATALVGVRLLATADVFDAKEKKLVWRGIGQAELKPGQTAEKRAVLVREAVKEILKRYPPKA